jgi:AbrB family looped-hinge helix DNA binding protein
MTRSDTDRGAFTKQLTVTLTHRNRITVPAEVRRLLGVMSGDKLTFQIEDGSVRLVPARFTLDTAFSSVHPVRTVADLDAEIRAAKDDKAAEALHEISGE